MTHRPSPTGEKGFTLIELLVVLAIMGLLLLASPALLSQAVPSVTAKAAVWQLAAELRAARAVAIEQDRDAEVILDLTSRTYTSPDHRVVALPRDLTWSVASRRGTESDNVVITFYADGSSTGSSIDLRYRDRLYRVTDHWLTGRVSIDG